MEFPTRINKYLRDIGLASRREADRLVEAGLVFINGKRAESGMQVNEGDDVTVKGQRKQYRYLLYHKPVGQAMQKLTAWEKKGLHPAGELDKEAQGIMILTDDGRLARAIASEDPAYEKEYVVEVKEQLRVGIPDILAKGMDTEALGKLPSVKAELINKNTLRIFLTQERHHQIRIMLSELQYTIVSLKRIRIGRFRLGDLEPGKTRSFQPQRE